MWQTHWSLTHTNWSKPPDSSSQQMCCTSSNRTLFSFSTELIRWINSLCSKQRLRVYLDLFGLFVEQRICKHTLKEQPEGCDMNYPESSEACQREEGRGLVRQIEPAAASTRAQECGSRSWSTCAGFSKRELKSASHCRAALLKSFRITSKRNCCKKPEISALTAWEMK